MAHYPQIRISPVNKVADLLLVSPSKGDKPVALGGRHGRRHSGIPVTDYLVKIPFDLVFDIDTMRLDINSEKINSFSKML
jgi:hypothetical protein